jgi:hypothetical protein
MKILLIFLAIMFPMTVRADAVADEIIGRYNISLGRARNFCTGLGEKIDSVKIMAGIGIASGAVGTIGGAGAAIVGFMKDDKDEKIKGMENPDKTEARMKELLAKEKDKTIKSTSDEAVELVKLIKYVLDNKAKFPKMEKDLADAKKDSKNFGNLRTGGAFAAGGTGAVGAITSFAGIGTLDKLIEDMNACDSYVREIEKQKDELTFAAPNDATLSQMNKLVESCKGMSSKNIADVKSKLKAAGIISAIGAAAGIAGGITSAIAVGKETDPNNKENTKIFNTTANITSGVAAAGGLGGAILSGVTLSGLNKNGDIAAKCKAAF